MIQGLILGIKHGLKRGDWWHFQMAVPKRLQAVYGCELLKEATGTKDDIRAAQIIAALAHRYKKEFELIDCGKLKAPQALDRAAKNLLKQWGLAANSVHNDETLELLFTQTLYDKDERGEEIGAAELRAAKLLSTAPKDRTDIILSEMPALYLKEHTKPTDDLASELERSTRFLIDAIGEDMRYKDLERTHLNAYRDYLREVKGNATGTIKRRIDTLKPMFEYCALELGIDKKNPALDIKIRGLGQDSKPRLSFTNQELDKIKLNLDLKNEVHLILKVLMESTGRLNEIAGLEVKDLFLDAKIPYLAIRPNSNRRNEGLKTDFSERNVPIVNPETLEALREWLKGVEGKDAFPSWAAQTKTKSWGVGRPIRDFLRKLGINKSTHHTRHTNAAQLRNVGCSDSIRCAIGGWSCKDEGAAAGYGKIEYLGLKAEWLKKALETRLEEIVPNV